MKLEVKNLMKKLAFATLSAIGAAGGSGNRARTIRSKKEKAEDPRLLRKRFKQDYETL